MPCYNTILNTVDLKLANPQLVEAAIKSLDGSARRLDAGWQFTIAGNTYTFAGGQIVGRGDIQNVANTLKSAYSRAAVATAAKRFGWQVKGAGNKLQVTRKA